jgi:hypothetical protein
MDQEQTAKLDHLQETQAHNEARIWALRAGLRIVAEETSKAAMLGVPLVVAAWRSRGDLLREELLAAETPLSTVRAPGRRPVEPEVEGG